MPSYADLINKAKKDFKCDTLMSGNTATTIPKIPLSAPFMNYALYGGIPRGRMTEFFGEPGSGKSTTAVDACKNAAKIFKQDFEVEKQELRKKIATGTKSAQIELQAVEERGPRKVLYIDIEHGFDRAWSEKIGINPEEVDVMQPPNIAAEDLLQLISDVIETGDVGLVVLDSLAALVPRAELEKKFGERTVASLAGLLTIFFRKVTPLLARYDCTMICCNQTRENMDNPYEVKTPGGVSVKFFASLRILFRMGQPLDTFGNELPKNVEDPAGYIIQAKIIKQKTAPFNRKLGTYTLMCDSGIMPMYDYVKLAMTKYGIIAKAGAWMTLTDPRTGEVYCNDQGTPVKLNGLAKVYAYMEANPDYYNMIVDFIEKDLNGLEDTNSEENSDDTE